MLLFVGMPARTTKKKVKFIFKINKKILKPVAIIALVLAIACLLYSTRSLFFAAFVNYRPITRYALDRALEKQAGKQVLESEITRVLIEQEAAKQKIVVPDSDIDEKIKQIEAQLEAQGANLDNLLQSQGQTRDDVRKQIKVQLAVEKIIGKDLNVTDQELKDYYDKNKSYFAKGATFDSLKDQIKSEVINTKLSEKFQPWVEELKTKAKIHYFLNF